MRDTARYYRTKHKDLWVPARKGVIEGIKKHKRAWAVEE
jgi:hypothetical protein